MCLDLENSCRDDQLVPRKEPESGLESDRERGLQKSENVGRFPDTGEGLLDDDPRAFDDARDADGGGGARSRGGVTRRFPVVVEEAFLLLVGRPSSSTAFATFRTLSAATIAQLLHRGDVATSARSTSRTPVGGGLVARGGPAAGAVLGGQARARGGRFVSECRR